MGPQILIGPSTDRTKIVSYNQCIDEQFVENVISDIKESEQFHSDTTVSCESDQTDLDSIVDLGSPTDCDELIINDLMDYFECDMTDLNHLSQLQITADSMQYTSNTSSAAALCEIQKHLVQRYSENRNVFFDQIASSNGRVSLLDSKGLTSGRHQWKIQILQTDVDLQEMGVVGQHGKLCCVYGNTLSSFSSYIKATNEDDTTFEFQDLSQQRRIGWCVYDTITVHLDLDAWTLRFLLNDAHVGHEVKLPQGTYHPVIAFSGRCRYDLR